MKGTLVANGRAHEVGGRGQRRGKRLLPQRFKVDRVGYDRFGTLEAAEDRRDVPFGALVNPRIDRAQRVGVAEVERRHVGTKRRVRLLDERRFERKTLANPKCIGKLERDVGVGPGEAGSQVLRRAGKLRRVDRRYDRTLDERFGRRPTSAEIDDAQRLRDAKRRDEGVLAADGMQQGEPEIGLRLDHSRLRHWGHLRAAL